MLNCPNCNPLDAAPVTRRSFVRTVGGTALAAAAVPALARAAEESAGKPESLVKKLYDSLKPEQREEVAFAWDHTDDRGLLRMHVSNNWHITEPRIASNFFTKDQQDIIEAIFWDLYSPEWHDRIRKQLKDDAGGYGKEQSIAIFGEPGTGKFEFVMTGRHLTIRCDGDSTEHTAFGGPIFYGHAAQDFNEKADHAGNVFWPQALKANELFKMLNGKQRDQALVAKSPAERMVFFQPKAEDRPGVAIADLSADQKAHAQQILNLLLEPYRLSDQAEARKCLESKGGLDACKLAFFQEPDIGNDQVWDNWRLEGPTFVWHYRGAPHVHVWVNVADDSNVKITTKG